MTRSVGGRNLNGWGGFHNSKSLAALEVRSPFRGAKPTGARTLVPYNDKVGTVTTFDGAIFFVALPCEHATNAGQDTCRFGCRVFTEAHRKEG